MFFSPYDHHRLASRLSLGKILRFDFLNCTAAKTATHVLSSL